MEGSRPPQWRRSVAALSRRGRDPASRGQFDGVLPESGATTTGTTAAGALDPDASLPSVRAVRVSLTPSSGHADLEPCVVDVDASGQPLVVGAPDRPSTLRRLDAERAVLSTGGDNVRRVLLLPVSGGTSKATGCRRREVIVDGWRVEVDVESESRAALRARARRGTTGVGVSGPTEVRAMIPGVVFAVAVAVGDTVSAGQKIVVVEAMKMQNELRAPRDGTVDRVVVATGARIEVGDLLLVIT